MYQNVRSKTNVLTPQFSLSNTLFNIKNVRYYDNVDSLNLQFNFQTRTRFWEGKAKYELSAYLTILSRSGAQQWTENEPWTKTA